jgi:hypothetical protein
MQRRSGALELPTSEVRCRLVSIHYHATAGTDQRGVVVLQELRVASEATTYLQPKAIEGLGFGVDSYTQGRRTEPLAQE